MDHPTEAPEDRLIRLGIDLPQRLVPGGSYVPWRIAGSLLFLSGQGPKKPDGTFETGVVGADVTIEEAQRHARLCGINLIAAAKLALGDLDRVDGVIKVFGMVQATEGFMKHPSVINGCSDLLEEVFGEAGRHARSAVGMATLPNRMTVEVEAVLSIAITGTPPHCSQRHTRG